MPLPACLGGGLEGAARERGRRDDGGAGRPRHPASYQAVITAPSYLLSMKVLTSAEW